MCHNNNNNYYNFQIIYKVSMRVKQKFIQLLFRNMIIFNLITSAQIMLLIFTTSINFLMIGDLASESMMPWWSGFPKYFFQKIIYFYISPVGLYHTAYKKNIWDKHFALNKTMDILTMCIVHTKRSNEVLLCQDTLCIRYMHQRELLFTSGQSKCYNVLLGEIF